MRANPPPPDWADLPADYRMPHSHLHADAPEVRLQRELSKIDANRVRYTTSSELVSRRLAVLRYAAGDGS